MLKNRVITATCLAGALFLLLFTLPVLAFQGVILLIVLMGAYEWAGLSKITGTGQKWLYTFAVAMLAVGASVWLGLFTEPATEMLREVLGAAWIFWAVSLLWVISYPASSAIWGKPVFIGLMGLIILVPAALSLFYLLGLETGREIFLILVGLVCTADIGAYFAGKALGKRKLAPKVSPGKSWAGFIGGLCAGGTFAFFVGIFFNPLGDSLAGFVVVSLVVVLASVLGDLVESMVKRQVNVKDSSHLLPGHGGFMDRIDSMTAAAPAFTLLLLLLR